MRIVFAIAALLALPAIASEPHQSPAKLQFGQLIAQSYDCTPRKKCGQIRSCDEAVWYLYNCSWGGRLDGDSDGAPCETLCGSNN
jgi:Excalibur calcium-binding domain